MSDQTDEMRKHAYRWVEELWNNKNLDVIDELADEELVSYMLPGAAARGPGQCKQFYRNMFLTLPDAHVTVEDTIVEGDKVVTRWTLKGTVTATDKLPGVSEGISMGFAKPNQEISFSGVTIARLENGRTMEAWNFGSMAPPPGSIQRGSSV